MSYSKPGLAGDHLFKGGVQFARLYFDDANQILGNMYLNYSNNAPINVQEFNTPTEAVNVDKVFGVFGQDSWSVGRNLTLNLGVRFDHNIGILPAQSTAGGPFIAARSIPESTPIKQNLFVWRTGVTYDPLGDGKTALKASASRYGLQVGIDRVLNVNPLQSASQTCPWTDPNKDGIAQPSEYGTGCSGFPSTTIRYAGANGPRWPYSDEITAGVEREVIKNMRVGVMYYHRTNRDQIGTRNTAVSPSAYTPFTSTSPMDRTVRPPRRCITSCPRLTGCRPTSWTTTRISTHVQRHRDHCAKAILAAMADGGRFHRRQEHAVVSSSSGGSDHRPEGGAGDLNDPNRRSTPRASSATTRSMRSGCRAAIVRRTTSRWPARWSRIPAIRSSRLTR